MESLHHAPGFNVGDDDQLANFRQIEACWKTFVHGNVWARPT